MRQRWAEGERNQALSTRNKELDLFGVFCQRKPGGSSGWGFFRHLLQSAVGGAEFGSENAATPGSQEGGAGQATAVLGFGVRRTPSLIRSVTWGGG